MSAAERDLLRCRLVSRMIEILSPSMSRWGVKYLQIQNIAGWSMIWKQRSKWCAKWYSSDKSKLLQSPTSCSVFRLETARFMHRHQPYWVMKSASQCIVKYNTQRRWFVLRLWPQGNRKRSGYSSHHWSISALNAISTTQVVVVYSHAKLSGSSLFQTKEQGHRSCQKQCMSHVPSIFFGMLLHMPDPFCECTLWQLPAHEQIPWHFISSKLLLLSIKWIFCSDTLPSTCAVTSALDWSHCLQFTCWLHNPKCD